jgi:hypothetical protein
MRVVRLRATGGPEQLAVEEAGRPRPGPGKALVRMHAAAITRDEPAGSVRRGPGDLEPPRAHPEPELARAHARGLRVYVKEALANSRLAGREPTPALEAAARSAGTTPDALALAAVPARPWADVIVSGAASVRRPRARSPRGSRRTSTSRATTQARRRGCSSTARYPRQGPPGAGRAQASAPPRWRAGCCPASRESTLAEAEKPQVDELIRPVVALAGPGARAGTRRFHGPRRGGRRDAQDPEPGRPAHRPSRRASARGAWELMMRAPRPRVTKLNAQLMSTSRRFWKPTR